MLYVIPDTLLKVAFNTNKTDHHVIRVLNATFNNVSGITYNMVASLIAVERHFEQCVVHIKVYIVESGVKHK
jgi:hypothetical protein